MTVYPVIELIGRNWTVRHCQLEVNGNRSDTTYPVNSNEKGPSADAYGPVEGGNTSTTGAVCSISWDLLDPTTPEV